LQNFCHDLSLRQFKPRSHKGAIDATDATDAIDVFSNSA
jgi:hypothetical protein